MQIHPQVASVVGKISDNRWGQVLLTPHAYGVIQVYTPDGIARQKGVEVLTNITHALADPPVSLSALDLIADDAVTEDVASLIVLVPVGKVMYLVCRGKGAVYLKRKDQLAVLIDGAGGLSGELQVGDTVIAASSGFVETLTRDEIMGVFDHLTPQEVAEKLTILLHERGGAEGGAALIFHIVPEKNEDPEPEPVSPVVSARRVGSARPFLQLIVRGVRRFTNPRQRMALRRSWSALWGKLRAVPPKRLIATIVVALFALSVFFGIASRNASVTNTRTAEVLAQAQHAFDEGVALGDLNPVKGRERLTQARDLLAPIVEKKSNSRQAQKAKELYELVTENLTLAMHIIRTKPELFFDAALLKNGAIASDISLFEDTLGILDTTSKTVFTLDITTKRGAVVAGGNAFVNATHIASYSDAVFVFGPKGITRVRLSDQKATANTIETDPAWGNVTGLVAYGGNLYLLDIVKSRIWKYVATETGFSDLREYLNPDAFPDLSAATSIAIDGSVWLGSIKSTIHRFTLGKEDSFTPQGVIPPLGKNLSVFVSDEAKLVYVLDKTGNRVVVLDKDGMYLSQYTWDTSFAPTEIAVSESLKKILLLFAGKIYSIKLE